MSDSEEEIEMPKLEEERDIYCWQCHRHVDTLSKRKCQDCVRVYHSSIKCAVVPHIQGKSWTCLECLDEKASDTLHEPKISCKRLNKLLSFVINRMELCDGFEHFLEDVDIEEYPDYVEYIINPMSISRIKEKIKDCSYKKTTSFLRDIKWIYHNSFIYNSKTAELTVIARRLQHVVKQELREIDNCSYCYENANTITEANWFIEPCAKPHLLVWAKLHGFPFWPAKVIKIDDLITVRFFGDHNSSRIQPTQCFLYSKTSPNISQQNNLPLKATKLRELRNAIAEVNDHITQLKKRDIKFVYADKNTTLNVDKFEEQRRTMLVKKHNKNSVMEKEISTSPKEDIIVNKKAKKALRRNLSPDIIKRFKKVKNDFLTVNKSKKRKKSVKNIPLKKRAKDTENTPLDRNNTNSEKYENLNGTDKLNSKSVSIEEKVFKKTVIETDKNDKTEIIVIDSESEEETGPKSTEDYLNKVLEEYNNAIHNMSISSDEEALESFKIESSCDKNIKRPKIQVRKDVGAITKPLPTSITSSLSPVENVKHKIEKVKTKIEALGYLPGNVKEIINEFMSAFQLNDVNQYMVTEEQIRQLQQSTNCIVCINKAKCDKNEINISLEPDKSSKCDTPVNTTVNVLPQATEAPLAPVSKKIQAQSMFALTTVRLMDSNNKERLETRFVPLSNSITITKTDAIKNNNYPSTRFNSVQKGTNNLVQNSVNIIPNGIINPAPIRAFAPNYTNKCVNDVVSSVFLRPTVTIQRVPQQK